MKNKKIRDLIIILVIYVVAFGIGYVPCLFLTDTMLKLFVFDSVATVVVFVFSVFILFNIVSIPLMEKRQLSRRAAYKEYKLRTSRLLLLPRKNKKL